MVTDVNQNYYDNYLEIYTNAGSFYHTPETNIVLYVNDTSIKSIRK